MGRVRTVDWPDMLFIRFVGLLIALIEAVLALRLLFPLMRIPKSMDGYVPMLTSISDWLMAPFQSMVRPFRLEGLEGLPAVPTWATSTT